ncbi:MULTISPECIES: very short patch repair endonuclease [unclassified Inquilinus]|uniref:very short patch repair endonuclease n=1 Tax=unclassified Inquilinus TaxID=2645927 RepID=UPI003F8E9B19
MDSLTPAERSARMALIRSGGTLPEVLLRRALHGLGLRFVLHKKELPGRPDLVFPKHRAVVFVHGCFWHRHSNCKVASTPKSNTRYWQDKFDRNVERDVRVQTQLLALGWRVFVVWECELRSRLLVRDVAERLASAISSEDSMHGQLRLSVAVEAAASGTA